MTKKTEKFEYKFTVDGIVDCILASYPIDNLDNDVYKHNQVTGEENPRYMQDDKYMIGGIISQIGFALQRKHDYLDTLQARRIDEATRNGENTPEVKKMESLESKIQRSVDFYHHIYLIHCEMFERLCDLSWGEGQSLPSDDRYGLAWWETYKARMQDRPVLATTANEEAKSRLIKKAS